MASPIIEPHPSTIQLRPRAFRRRHAFRQSVRRSGAGLFRGGPHRQFTTAITRLRDSFVIAHTTATTFKSKPVDAKTIGRDLGVHYVLEGSVQPTGNQVRVNAQFIDAESGAICGPNSSNAPRRSLQMQDDIVTRLARSMYLQLPEVGTARLKHTSATSTDAEEFALQCQAGFLTRNEVTFLANQFPLRTGARGRSQQCPRPDLVGSPVLAFAWPRQLPRGKPQSGRRIGVEGAGIRSKLRSRSPL